MSPAVNVDMATGIPCPCGSRCDSRSHSHSHRYQPSSSSSEPPSPPPSLPLRLLPLRHCGCHRCGCQRCGCCRCNFLILLRPEICRGRINGCCGCSCHRCHNHASCGCSEGNHNGGCRHRGRGSCLLLYCHHLPTVVATHIWRLSISKRDDTYYLLDKLIHAYSLKVRLLNECHTQHYFYQIIPTSLLGRLACCLIIGHLVVLHLYDLSHVYEMMLVPT